MEIEASESKSLVGTTLDSRYAVIELIGQGGMSTVYKAHHLFLDRDVAIKIMQDHMATQNEGQLRFQREGKAAAALNHPNIVSVMEFGVFEGQPYMVMDYLQGLSLADYLKQKGRPNPALALKIFKQASSALQHAHEKGIVHRDLKPSNVMLVRAPGDNSITCKVVDFGLARFLPRAGEEPRRLTAAGELVGSPFYMSPEQIRDEELDARSDIYSFGCLMYEVLTGVRPFLDTNAITVLSMHLYESPPPFGLVLQPNRLPPRIESVVMKCLEKSRSNRFQTMKELCQQLETVPEWEDGPSKSTPYNPNIEKPSVPSGITVSQSEVFDGANTGSMLGMQHMTLRLKRPADRRFSTLLKTALKPVGEAITAFPKRVRLAFEGKGPAARRKKVSGTRILVAALGDSKEMIDAADQDYSKYAVYFKNVERKRSMNAQEFLVLLSSECFDIIHLHGRFDRRAVFEDSTGFQLRLSDVKRACDYSQVKMLWLASDNNLHYLRDNPVLDRPPFHLVLTSSRGENFPKFLSTLLARIARGESVISAWNSFVPQAQFKGERTNCRVITAVADTCFLP